MSMTAAHFYDEHEYGAVCEISRPGGRVRMRVKGAYLVGSRIVIGDSHGRSFRLSFTETVVLIARS